MTEREKMEHGLLYDANYDEELLEERARCKDLCFSYNQLKPSLVSEQEIIIRQLLWKTGERFCITAPFWCDYWKQYGDRSRKRCQSGYTGWSDCCGQSLPCAEKNYRRGQEEILEGKK